MKMIFIISFSDYSKTKNKYVEHNIKCEDDEIAFLYMDGFNYGEKCSADQRSVWDKCKKLCIQLK